MKSTRTRSKFKQPSPTSKIGATKGKPFYEHLTTIASLTGLILTFVAALGFPAATLQYVHLGIPTELLSYGRSLRAGIVPTMALIVAIALLFAIGKLLTPLAQKLKKHSRDNNSEISIYFLPVFLTLFVWLLIFFFANAAMVIWLSNIFLRYVANEFGIIWMLAVILFLVITNAFFYLRYFKQMRLKKLNESEQKARKKPFEFLFDEDSIPFIGAFAGVMFGGWHFLAFYGTRQILSESEYATGFLTMNILIITSICFGLIVGAVFYVSFTMPAFASKRTVIRRLAWLEIITYTLVTYFALVTFYSTSIYSRLPNAIGGGSPQMVSIWIEHPGFPLDMNALLPQAKCAKENQYWVCDSAYLLDVNAEGFILMDSQAIGSNSAVIPKSKVLALTKNR